LILAHPSNSHQLTYVNHNLSNNWKV
jgi:hypothetical protein